MNRREWFAGLAMQGMLASPALLEAVTASEIKDGSYIERLVKKAYEIADAMRAWSEGRHANPSPVAPASELVTRLEYLTHPFAEAMSDKERIDRFVRIANEAAAELTRLQQENERLRRWKALDKPLTAAMDIACKDLKAKDEEIARLREALDRAAPSPGAQEERSKTGDKNLDELLAKAAAWFDGLSPEEQENHLRLQRESWVRGEMAMGETSRVLKPPSPAAPASELVGMTHGEFEGMLFRLRQFEEGAAADLIIRLAEETARLREALKEMVLQFKGQLRPDAWEFEIGFDAAKAAVEKARAALDRKEG